MTQDNPSVPFSQGPFLGAAFLCEKVLQEKDGVISAIRIVDRITRNAIGPELKKEMDPFDHNLFLYLMFKAGSARGPMELNIRLEDPSGASKSPFTQTINFEGDDDRGANIVAELRLKIEMPGLHWFDVVLDGVRLTRTPLRVIYLPQIRQTPARPE
ncbi:MAG: hypothetical protein IH873_02320 [Chloroflexi bacterium]|nr:hypothetical protein [Chloroflexota bacterium]